LLPTLSAAENVALPLLIDGKRLEAYSAKVDGAPKETQESAYRAVLTALDLRAGLGALNEHLVARGEAPIRIGVGINTGLALAGAVGPREQQEYTVIGDSVNLASRIEALNKQYPEHGILISEWKYEALGSHQDEFELLSLGKVDIRGKAEGVEIWAVKGRRSQGLNKPLSENVS
jgi:adenylate cyclase